MSKAIDSNTTRQAAPASATPSRRGVLSLAGLLPLAIVPSLPARAADPDADRELIALSAEFDRLEAAYMATMYNGPAGTRGIAGRGAVVVVNRRGGADMSRPNASRRQLFGAGAALLLLAPAAIGTTKAAEIDGELLDLCAELEKRQAEVKRVAADPTDGELVKLDVALDDWWETVVEITDTPARTPEGVRAKAGAVRTAIVGTNGDSAPMVSAMVASLLTDMLGEPVRLPGMEDGA